MIVQKHWIQQRRLSGGRTLEWEMEGWFLFGPVPLFKRDLQPRGRFGKIN